MMETIDALRRPDAGSMDGATPAIEPKAPNGAPQPSASRCGAPDFGATSPRALARPRGFRLRREARPAVRLIPRHILERRGGN